MFRGHRVRHAGGVYLTASHVGAVVQALFSVTSVCRYETTNHVAAQGGGNPISLCRHIFHAFIGGIWLFWA